MATEILCEFCQKPFHVRNYEIKLRQLGFKRSLTCSRECAFAIRRGRSVPTRHRRVTLVCAQCKNPFIDTEVHAKERRFCCIQCKAEHQKTAMLGKGNHYFGRKHSEQTREKISENHFRGYGSANPNWRGGVTELKILIRKSKKYQQWRDAVYNRDHYCSVQSGTKGRAYELVAHHIKPFIEILREFLALYPDLDPLLDANKLCELAMKHKPFWDVANGMTLLRDEHQWLHSNQNETDDDQE